MILLIRSKIPAYRLLASAVIPFHAGEFLPSIILYYS